MIAALLALAACEPAPDPPAVDVTAAVVTPSVRADLRLKSWRQLSADLEAGLELTPGEVCRELDQARCTEVHRVRLGGTNWERSLYAPLDHRPSTYGTTVDRVALAACATRVRRDAAAPPGLGVLTGAVDITGGRWDHHDAVEVTVDLYRRLLGRDPLPEEVDLVLALRHRPAMADAGNAEWVTLACAMVATTTEAVLF